MKQVSAQNQSKPKFLRYRYFIKIHIKLWTGYGSPPSDQRSESSGSQRIVTLAATILLLFSGLPTYSS